MNQSAYGICATSNIQQTIEQSPSKGYRLANEIVDAIAAQYGLTRNDVCGPVRQRQYVLCRREIAKSLRLRGLTFAEIGHVMDKHHTTVMDLLQRGES